MTDETTITSTIDFQKDGEQYGYLIIPQPNNHSAWGVLKQPIIQIKNGDGPKILLTAGVHGDEFEGPLALNAISQALKHQQIRGQIIIVPSMNPVAQGASLRLSPDDQQDMNRCFPGKANGTLTEKIAHYVAHHLIPQVDYVIDFHSGGRSLEFLPVIIMHHLADRQQREKTMAALDAFGGQYGLVLEEISSTGMFDSYVEQLGKTFLTTELSGGIRVSSESMTMAKAGLRNYLLALECLTDAEALSDWKQAPCQMQKLEVPNHQYYVQAEHLGIFEPITQLGDSVKTGDILGYLHQLSPVNTPAQALHAQVDGLLVAKRALAQSQVGDCLFVIGRPYEQNH